MLVNRAYRPIDGEILYHYCSSETFLAVCNGKSLRFSDITSMNDFMERHWGYGIWERAARELPPEIGEEICNDIGEILAAAKTITIPLACCFSTDGDALSQWRAYAADGTGFALGFRGTDLVNLPAAPLRVSYDEEEQLQEVKELIRIIHRVEEEEKEKRSDDFRQACFRIAWDLAAFKNPAFAEEKEVRLLHVIRAEASNQSAKLVDGGGVAFGKPSDPMQLQFRMKGSSPVSYLDMDFTGNGQAAPIAEVVLGPKNNADPLWISIVLETLGIPNVKIRKSAASYR